MSDLVHSTISSYMLFKHLRLSCLVISALVGCICSQASAQVYFKFLDSNCYQPTVGKPGEIDTIYGSRNEQFLGIGLQGIGPAPGGSYQRIMLTGLPQNPPFESIIETGPNFDLHKLKSTGTDIQPSIFFIPFHPRSPQITDLFFPGTQPIIYWADQNGNFDTSRYTLLKRQLTDGRPAEPISNNYCLVPCTTDSVDDVVFVTERFDSGWYRSYLVIYNAASLSLQKASVIPDAFSFLDSVHQGTPYGRSFFVGTFSGKSRKNILVMDDLGNHIFFYANEEPFSLSKLANAAHYDTLFSGWQHPTLRGTGYNDIAHALSMQAFPKASWDKSQDLIWVCHFLDRDVPTGTRMYFFKGGPNFGSKRLTLDSADFVIRAPGEQDPTFGGGFGDQLYDCGDMTGTGNRVLLTLEGPDLLYGVCSFFVTGKALDDKVDLYYAIGPGGAALEPDTLTADHDNLQDVIIGIPDYYSYDDLNLGKQYVGSIHVVHGSKKIPVHISERFAVEKHAVAIGSMMLYPNPTHDHTSIECSFEHPGRVSIQIYDVLGRVVMREDREVRAGREVFSLSLNGLTKGAYSVRVSGSSVMMNTELIVQ
jgi:hypothetical protein